MKYFEPGVSNTIKLLLQLTPPRATRGGRTLVRSEVSSSVHKSQSSWVLKYYSAYNTCELWNP